MIELRNQPEIHDYDRHKPQILDSDHIVENMFRAVGFASRCWKGEGGTGTFDTDSAIRLANELCAYFRLVSQPTNNLEYMEWKYGKLIKEQENVNRPTTGRP